MSDLKVPKFKLSPAYIWLLVIGGLSLNYLAGFYPIEKETIDQQNVLIQNFLHPFMRDIFGYIFIIAVIVHFGEGIYTFLYLMSFGEKNILDVLLWTIQSTILGLGSLKPMWKLVKLINKVE